MKTNSPLQRRWLIFSLLFVLVFSGCTSLRDMRSVNPEPHYSLIVDAGSTGSRIYIYKVTPGKYGNVPGIEQIGQEKVKPGISDWNKDPAASKANLGKLVNAAKAKVPAADQKSTPLYLMATAGMRTLAPNTRDQIMEEISGYFKQDGTFDFKSAQTISGTYEGLYGWLAANYIDDQLDPNTTREGILEMGGASTQIAFVPSGSFDKPTQKRKFRGTTYKIFCHSYLYMGTNKALQLASTENCYPLNYPYSAKVKGTGDFDQCTKDIIEKFNALCKNLECDGPHCIFGDNFTPELQKKYLAYSGYWYTFSTLGIEDKVLLNELKAKGTTFCGTDWEELQKQYPKEGSYLKGYCFNAAYFHTLFEKGFRFPVETQSIHTADDLNGTDITWTLGALIDIENGYVPQPFVPGE